MKNMNDKTKRWLVIGSCLIVCIALVVLIGNQFKPDKQLDNLLIPDTTQTNDVTVDTDIEQEEKEDDLVIDTSDITQPDNEDSGAVYTGTEQTIQGDVTKPEYTEEQLTNPEQKPNGEPASESDRVENGAKVEKPTTPTTTPSGGLPGFDSVPNAGANQVTQADDMYENGNKIGIMD